MDKRMISVLCGTFLISFALLSFEITTVRTINFIVGPTYIYSAIALAMLGLSGAGALFSILDIKAGPASRERVLFRICVGIAVFLVLTQFLVADVKGTIDAALETAGREGGHTLVVKTLILQSLPAALKIGTVLLLPYFLFGALLSYLFATTDRESFGVVYAADLIGAASGCIGVIFVMETTSYAFSLTFPPMMALLAAAAYSARCGWRFLAGAIAGVVLLAVLPSAGWYEKYVEPPADPNYLVRDYSHSKHVRELWHGWNSYTRVGAVAVDDYAKMSLGNGEGMAWLPSYLKNRPRPWKHRPTIPALLLDPPKDALVIFAGAGADIISLRENGAQHVTGVEMNRLVPEGALRLARYRLRDALSDENIKLQISEARDFLERDTGKYDLVLVSYSGAPAAYYAGMLTGTVQHLFTYEGLTAILDHLKPNGYAVISQANKLSQLAALRRYLKARNIGSPWKKAVVLFWPGAKYTNGWSGSWDDNPLLIKPSGWTERDITKLRVRAEAEGLKIAYAPGMPTHPDYTVYERILKANDFEKELASIGAAQGRSFSVTTDDRPFIYDRFATSRYFTWDFWRGPFTSKKPVFHELFRWMQVMFLLIVIIFTLIIILGPLCILGGPAVKSRTLSHVAYFLCLGAGFIVIEVTLMQKFSLLFDTPGLSIAIVLGSVILFTGLGSMISQRTLAKGYSLREIASGIALYGVVLYFFLGAWTHAMLSWSLLSKGFAVAAVIAPGALLMGHMFPQALSVAAKDDIKLVPWAWGINGAMSTIGAGATPLAAMAWGYSDLLLVGAAFYAITVILPTTRKTYSRAELVPRLDTAT